jgi:hypothetical protein
MKRVILGSIVLALATAFSSCQTRKPPEEKGDQETVQQTGFTPGAAISRLHFDGGSYPDLFASSTYAVWVDEAVTSLRREAAVQAGETVGAEEEAEAVRIAREYVIVECHLDSVFSDMSIGYDAVGFRGLQVYLSTPDGRKIAPIQTLIGTPLKTEPREALKLFGRTNLVVFPKHDLWLGVPLVGKDAPSVRLVLEGHQSVFYFEWPTGVPAAPTPTVSAGEAAEVLKVGFREFHERVRQLAHIFG